MITDIHLQQFRSYKDDSFEFSKGVNIIVGPNASGKTNLLEAILVVARGASYRAKDSELIEFGKTWARAEAHTLTNDIRAVQLTHEADHTQKQYKINGQTFQRMNLTKSLPVIVFEPNHLQLLSGSPELRRQFLDDLLEQTTPSFSSARRQYKRALAQRNTLLKRGYRLGHAQIFAWDVRLSGLGEQIAQARIGLIGDMNKKVESLYRKLSKTKSSIRLNYRTSFSGDSYASGLLHKLEVHQAEDFERGFTAYGPHREDLEVFLDNHLAQEIASRGEARTLLLVLKILEAEIIEQAREVRPILLLDDVFSELDGARRQALTKFLQPYQTFITTTDADVVLQHFTESANIIPVQEFKG